MSRLLRELCGYCAASVAALAMDLLVLWALVSGFNVNPVAAATVSFLAGAIVAYRLSIRIAFRQHRMRDARMEFVCFVVIGTGGLLINALVMTVVVQFLSVHYLLARCLAAGFTFTFNFFARRQILFIVPNSTEASS